MSKLQSKHEEYAKNQRADTIYRILTNKPKSPKKDSKTSPKKDSKTSPKKDSKTSPKKDSALKSLRKDIIDKKKISFSDIPDDVIKIFIKKYKLLLKYKLREWIPLSKMDWSFFSLNPNAIDFLSLPENKKYIDYSQLSKNPNSRAIELIKTKIIEENKLSRTEYEKLTNKVDWSALSRNSDAIEILDKNRDKIKWYALAENPNPKAIQIIKENQLEKANGDDDIYWDNLYANTSTEAIDFLSSPENYRNIDWEFLSTNTNLKAIALLTKKESEEFDLEDAQFNRLKPHQKISWKYLSENPNAISLLQKKWDEEKELLRNDIKQYKLLKRKEYIIDWDVLSRNPNAIDLLRDKIVEENKLSKKKYDSLQDIEKINWYTLSANQNAIELLKENPTKINWFQLSKNPKAIKILEKELQEKPENIDWYRLSQNPEAIHILNKNRDKISWSAFSENPNAGELLEDRVKYEKSLKKKINEIPQFNRLHWQALSKNPSIFTY